MLSSCNQFKLLFVECISGLCLTSSTNSLITANPTGTGNPTTRNSHHSEGIHKFLNISSHGWDYMVPYAGLLEFICLTMIAKDEDFMEWYHGKCHPVTNPLDIPGI